MDKTLDWPLPFSGGSTLLGAGISPEAMLLWKKENLKSDEALGFYKAVLELWIESYAQGDLTMHMAIQKALYAGKIQNLNGMQRQKLLGWFIESIHQLPKSVRSKKSQRTLSKKLGHTCVDLIRYAKAKKYPVTKISHSKLTAFEHVTEIFNNRYIKVSLKQVIELYEKYNKSYKENAV